MCSVETVILIKQVGMDLYVGKAPDESLVYLPVKSSSIFTQLVDGKRSHIINEAAKDRQTMNEVRQAFNMESQKLQNCMIVPFGENTGRRGGAMILILINKFTMGEDDKP